MALCPDSPYRLEGILGEQALFALNDYENLEREKILRGGSGGAH
jgi:hypothetical protein